MLSVGFLEKAVDGYVVHEWVEHQGHLWAYHQRAKKGAKARWDKMAGESPPGPAPPRASSNASSMLEASVKQCAILPTSPTHTPAGDAGGGEWAAGLRRATLEAFGQWSQVSRGHGLREENNEHRPPLELIDTANQEPPITRGREVIPRGSLVPLAAEYAKRDRKEFKGIRYACKIVSEMLEKWSREGMPGQSGSNGARPSAPFKPQTVKT